MGHRSGPISKTIRPSIGVSAFIGDGRRNGVTFFDIAHHLYLGSRARCPVICGRLRTSWELLIPPAVIAFPSLFGLTAEFACFSGAQKWSLSRNVKDWVKLCGIDRERVYKDSGLAGVSGLPA